MIRSYQVGGDPDKEAFLERDLDMKLVEAQEDGIKILSITPFTISRAWSFKKQKYVSTLAFIIIADIATGYNMELGNDVRSVVDLYKYKYRFIERSK